MRDQPAENLILFKISTFHILHDALYFPSPIIVYAFICNKDTVKYQEKIISSLWDKIVQDKIP